MQRIRSFLTNGIEALVLIAAAACGGRQAPITTVSSGTYVADDSMTPGSTAIDFKDLDQMADQVIRGILSSPTVAGLGRPPVLEIDSDGWSNESAAVVNLDQLADEIRDSVVGRANQRVVVVDREHAAAIEQERALKRDGTVGQGTLAPTHSTLGVDYKLYVRITSHEGTNRRTGELDRTFTLAVQLTDLESGAIVWAPPRPFTIRKRGGDTEVYR